MKKKPSEVAGATEKEPVDRKGLIIFLIVMACMVSFVVWQMVKVETVSEKPKTNVSQQSTDRSGPSTTIAPTQSPTVAPTPTSDGKVIAVSKDGGNEMIMDADGLARMDSLLLFISVRYGMDPAFSPSSIKDLLVGYVSPTLISETVREYESYDRAALVKRKYLKIVDIVDSSERDVDETGKLLPASKVRIVIDYTVQEVEKNVGGEKKGYTGTALLEKINNKWVVITFTVGS